MRYLFVLIILMMSADPICDDSPPNKSNNDETITYNPDGGTVIADGNIRGLVTEQHSIPLNGAIVCCLGSDGSCLYSGTTSEGKYYIGKIPSNQYWIRVECEGYRSDSSYHPIRPGNNTGIDFKLYPD